MDDDSADDDSSGVESTATTALLKYAPWTAINLAQGPKVTSGQWPPKITYRHATRKKSGLTVGSYIGGLLVFVQRTCTNLTSDVENHAAVTWLGFFPVGNRGSPTLMTPVLLLDA